MKKLKVSKEFILEAHNSACSTWKSKIEKEFPQLFESKLEVGRWYKNGDEGWSKSIAFVEEINPDDKDEFRGYGFDVNGDWIKKDGYIWGSNNWILATESEVKTALIAEAEKRGFKEGVKHNITNGDKIVEAKDNRFGFYEPENKLLFNNWSIFENGVWATIIKKPIEMTVAEIEAKLGHSVKIVK